MPSLKDGRVGVKRYLLSAGIAAPTHDLPRAHSAAAYREYAPLQLAVTFGHRLLVDILLEFSTGLKSSHFVTPLNTHSSPVFLMVLHLVASGCVINAKVVEATNYRAGVLLNVASGGRHAHFHSSDWITMIVLLGSEIQRTSQADRPQVSVTNIDRVMKEVAGRSLKSPLAPLTCWKVARQYLTVRYVSRDGMEY
jgi:hypothetical protein